MKIYKNYTSGIGNVFMLLFLIFIAVILLLNIIDEIKINEYKSIKWYLITIVPIIFLVGGLFDKYYGKIILDKHKLYVNKIFCKVCIPFYNILTIEEPYIMTINKVIYLLPEEKSFWTEINRIYIEYCNINDDYFRKTDDIYEELYAIMFELNEEEFRGNENHVIQRLPVYVAYFVLLKNLINIIKKYLFSDYFKNRKELKKYIEKYKGKPNFV
jgi:hypothetical protein